MRGREEKYSDYKMRRIMWKKLIYIIGLSLPFAFQACSDDEPGTDSGEGGGTQVEVIITTEVETKATVVTALGDGDEMNVYAKTYGDIEAADLVENVVATNTGGTWTLEPAVRISEGGRAFLYAVSPYSADNTDPAAIPVDISAQEDVLYSGSFVPVTYTTHTARLNMKHALMLLTFNILKQGYTGNGTLQSLSVAGEPVYTSGTMNVSNGKIVGTGKDVFVASAEKVLTGEGWTEDLPRFWAIPFSTQGQEAVLTAVVDGKSYEARFPDLEMKGGFQYIFRLVMTANGLQFIPGQLETVSLNLSDDQPEALEGYGVLTLTHSSTDFVLPLLTGDNVFGTVDWGDGNSGGYEIGGGHAYATGGAWETIIESWNSTGFELSTLNGIEEIDLSGY